MKHLNKKELQFLKNASFLGEAFVCHKQFSADRDYFQRHPKETSYIRSPFPHERELFGHLAPKGTKLEKILVTLLVKTTEFEGLRTREPIFLIDLTKP